MKKGVFLFFMIATCYIAGMYRSMPLLVLVTLEGLLLFVMFLLPHYLKRVLKIGFLSGRNAVQQGTSPNCRILVKNKGIFPAGRFQLRIRFEYQYEKKKYRIRMFGMAGGHGESQLSFSIHTPYCGLLKLTIERVRFYDYLSLFSSGKKQTHQKQTNTMQLFVLPNEPSFSILYNCPEWSKEIPLWEETARVGTEQMEIRQLREYHQGDEMRRIHWKLSARMQQFWVKEWERQADSVVDFFLELAGEVPTVEGMNRFYQMLSAILFGLMQRVDRIRVHWLESKTEEEIVIEIRDFDGYQEVFFRLYQFDVLTAQADKEQYLFWQSTETGQEVFRFNRKLEWYYKEALIIKFSEQEYQQKKEQRIFQIGK